MEGRAEARDFGTFFSFDDRICSLLCFFSAAYLGLQHLGLVSVHWFGLENSARETCEQTCSREVEGETAGVRGGALYQ